MHEVHCPRLIRPRGCAAVLPQLCLDPPLGCFAVQLQAQFPVNPAALLVIDAPALAPQQHMNTSVTVAHPRLADFPDPPLEAGLLGAAGLVAVSGGVHTEHSARPPDRHIPLTPHPVHQLALASRPYRAQWMMSCSISRSRIRSATIRFSLAFSSSSCLRRRISGCTGRRTSSSS